MPLSTSKTLTKLVRERPRESKTAPEATVAPASTSDPIVKLEAEIKALEENTNQLFRDMMEKFKTETHTDAIVAKIGPENVLAQKAFDLQMTKKKLSTTYEEAQKADQDAVRHGVHVVGTEGMLMSAPQNIKVTVDARKEAQSKYQTAQTKLSTLKEELKQLKEKQAAPKATESSVKSKTGSVPEQTPIGSHEIDLPPIDDRSKKSRM